MRSLGFAAKETYNRYCFDDGSPVSNMFLNLKYLIERDSSGAYNPLFESLHSYGDVYLLKNSLYLPLGFLVNDDPEDWYEALCKVIDDALLRNRCVCSAQKLLLDRFTEEAIAKTTEKTIPELTAYDAPRIPCKSLFPQRQLYRLQADLPKLGKTIQTRV